MVYEWNKSETIHNHYANLDAYLYNGNCHLFVEMKMLEPLMRVHSFKSVDKYLEKDVCPKEFQNAIKCFQKKEPEFFDAFQMIKHLLAIYNYFKKLELKDSQKVVLLNCHWEPSEAYISNHTYGNRAISLQETYNLFNETAKRFKEMEASFMPLFKGIGVNIKLETCDHRKIIELVGKTDNKYLKRYDI